jgi:hypothetical protein
MYPFVFLFEYRYAKPVEELKRIAENEITKEINEAEDKRHHAPFHPCVFEPFIPIRPHVWYWFLFDTSTVLRNVIIVCDRVAVYVQKYERANNMDQTKMTVAEWRATCRHESIVDQSLAWGYVSAQPANHIAASNTYPSFFRHIEHMCIDDVIKVHEYLHTGLPPTVISIDGDVAVV